MSDSFIDFEAYNHHINEVKFHTKKKKESIIAAIEELLIKGYPKEKISAKIKKDLDGFANPNYIQELCTQRGCSDQTYNQVDNKVEAKIQAIVEKESGGALKVVWKGDDNPRGVAPRANSSPPVPTPTEKENKILIESLEKKVKLFKDIIDMLETNPFTSKLTKEQKIELTECVYLADKATEMVGESFDNRQSIPTWAQTRLAIAVSDELTKHSALVFLAKVKEVSDISAKQIRKVLSGMVRTLNPIWEPNDLIEAQIAGFYGKPCIKCKSYRVKYEFGWLHCFKCEYDSQAKGVKPPLAGKKDTDNEGT